LQRLFDDYAKPLHNSGSKPGKKPGSSGSKVGRNTYASTPRSGRGSGGYWGAPPTTPGAERPKLTLSRFRRFCEYLYDLCMLCAVCCILLQCAWLLAVCCLCTLHYYSVLSRLTSLPPSLPHSLLPSLLPPLSARSRPASSTACRSS
jgi:hypothetical protein